MSDLFSDLKCGIASDNEIETPISLSCGHYICKTCVPNSTFIICKICSLITHWSELQFDFESVPIKKRDKKCLSGLFDDLEKRATDEINKFKS